MRKSDILRSAWNNLKRNKTRSILTIIAVFVGATTITITNGIGAGIKSYLDAQVGTLGGSNILITTQKSNSKEDSDAPQKFDPNRVRTQANGPSTPESAASSSPFQSAFMLTQADINRISDTPNVVSVNPILSLTPDYITTGTDKYIIEAQPAISNAMVFDIAAGKPLNTNSTEREVLLPTSYLGSLGFNSAREAVGKNIALAVSDQNKNRKEFNATIVGVINKSFVSSNSLILNNAFTEEAVAYQSIGKPASQKNLYGAAITEFSDTLTEVQTEELKNSLGEKGYRAVTVKDQQKMVFSVIDAIILVLNMFGVVALTAASFGIINTLYMAVQERTKEIGLMKAVGMSRGKIFALFSIEASLLGLIGSALGITAANAIGRAVNNMASRGILKDFEGLQLLSFESASVIIIIIVVTLIAFLAGTLPARKASKLDPIQALRYE